MLCAGQVSEEGTTMQVSASSPASQRAVVAEWSQQLAHEEPAAADGRSLYACPSAQHCAHGRSFYTILCLDCDPI